MTLALSLLFRFTRVGLAMRASAAEREKSRWLASRSRPC